MITINSLARKLAFKGKSNWDLYTTGMQGSCALVALPKPGTGACATFYGDKKHISHLMNTSGFDYEPTEHGLEFISGICSRIAPNSTNHKRYHFVSIEEATGRLDVDAYEAQVDADMARCERQALEDYENGDY